MNADRSTLYLVDRERNEPGQFYCPGNLELKKLSSHGHGYRRTRRRNREDGKY